MHAALAHVALHERGSVGRTDLRCADRDRASGERSCAVEHVAVVEAVAAEALHERHAADARGYGECEHRGRVDRMVTMPVLLLVDTRRDRVALEVARHHVRVRVDHVHGRAFCSDPARRVPLMSTVR